MRPTPRTTITPRIIQNASKEPSGINGNTTFIPNNPVTKVKGRIIDEIRVRIFIISFVLLVYMESNVFDRPSIKSS